MALTAQSLVTIANGPARPAAGAVGRRRLHMYASDDAYAAVVAADYFLGVYNQLGVGDVIICTLNLDGTGVATALVVLASSSTTVTTTPFIFA